ncbi:hypothetical protein FOWG_14046 [Fusarium oxysporum f. sp. lycopersici MN25]|nr:hypothetical protein FOWG_14046 [Fusarium oxysporum f. sp. lycopersici MN25]KAJ4275210.1 hypothetical protein NW764_010718 [Fusarium oxysporum]
MKCDGYAPPKPKASKRSKRRDTSSKPEVAISLPLLSMQTVDQLSLLSDPEKVCLQHFLHWTAKQLSPSSAAMNFWLKYALPMSYHYDAIRYSMIAVGASHRAYMAQSLPYSRPDRLQRPVIQHYNRAISKLCSSTINLCRYQPTFSLDGCLVSGLSFVAISTQGGDEKVQALDLLRKLNHREGIFDSNDIVEMHELVAMDMDWGSGSDSDSDTDIEEPDPPLRAPKGIPQMIEVLARKTGKTSKRLEGLYP